MTKIITFLFLLLQIPMLLRLSMIILNLFSTKAGSSIYGAAPS